MFQQLYQQLMRLFGEPRTYYEAFILLADILIVYYVIYRLLLLIQGTRALQMLIGLLLIVIGYFFSDFLGLSTLHWIISNFIFQVFLLIIVVFQNDIRRALIRLGRSPFLAGASTREDIFLLEELVRASVSLASKRIGAIIVVERSADVTEFIDSGTRIDGKVTKELLQAIFVPEAENPIHDGAVIVRGGRLYAAGCFLPLSQSTRLDRNLGTRHRAALGITEQTDAVVIVVSEERGAASLCMDGQLAKDLGADELRAALIRCFEQRWGKEQPKEAIAKAPEKPAEKAERAETKVPTKPPEPASLDDIEPPDVAHVPPRNL
jgi:diadenylate cyclase